MTDTYERVSVTAEAAERIIQAAADKAGDLAVAMSIAVVDESGNLGGPAGIERFIVFGGGYPLKCQGRVVGGIGVSGGDVSQDMEVAQAAVLAFGN